MTTDTTSSTAAGVETKAFLSEDWFDPLEAGVRTRLRSFIEELLEARAGGCAWPQALRARQDTRDRAQRPSGEVPGVGPPPRPSGTDPDGDVRRRDGLRAAGPACHARRRDHGMAHRLPSSLPVPDAPSRGADRERLSGRHQHAP